MKVKQKYTSLEEIPLVLTVEDVADILHIGRTCAYRLIQSGDLDSFKVGTKRRVFKKQLLSFMSESGIHFD